MARNGKDLASAVDRISESDYAKAFQEKVVPFWEAGTTSFLEGQDGLRLHTWHRLHPDAKAQILISHGYAENSLKYRELAFNFYQRGYSVFFWDHRGHGKSGRVGRARYSVDVIRFTDYSDDLLRIVDSMPLRKDIPQFIFAHSMGAAIALDFMQKNPGFFQAAVLSSPMLAPRLQGLPVALIIWLARSLAWLHAPDLCSVGSERIAAEFWSFRLAGTRSLARFEHFKADTLAADLRLAGPTNRWVITAFETAASLLEPERMVRLQLPLFVATAGRDRLVRADAIQEFCARATQCESHIYPESFHEIWNERDAIRNAYLDDVLAFYQRREKT